jgi:hypothetical protein
MFARLAMSHVKVASPVQRKGFGLNSQGATRARRMTAAVIKVTVMPMEDMSITWGNGTHAIKIAHNSQRGPPLSYQNVAQKSQYSKQHFQGRAPARCQRFWSLALRFLDGQLRHSQQSIPRCHRPQIPTCIKAFQVVLFPSPVARQQVGRMPCQPCSLRVRRARRIFSQQRRQHRLGFLSLLPFPPPSLLVNKARR